MEMFVAQGVWVNSPRERSDYVKMYEYIFPKLLKEYDPSTFYWPASPSSGGAFDEPNDENRGDVHYWDVWHGNKPFTEYRRFYFRYLSEFGFQSFPGIRTIESFTLPEDRNVYSYVMEKHQRNNAANGKIASYMSQTYLYPTTFETFLYASQLLQAQAMRYGVEHFRRWRGRCMGTVIWQLNDCWPVASWSSIDYYGRWKALHYYEKRFFAPLLLSCEEEGILTQDTNPNAEPYEVRKSVRLNVSNETLQKHTVLVRWELRDFRGEKKRQELTTLTIPALSAQWLEKTELPEASLYEDHVYYELEEDGQLISSASVIFCQPKYYHFINPELAYVIQDDEIIVTSKAYAKDVEIQNDREDLLLSDNYFDMEPGEKRVKILRGVPTGIRLRSTYDIR
jgi:beta-mannosidase